VPICAINTTNLIENEGERVYRTDSEEKNVINFRDKNGTIAEGGFYSFYSTGYLKVYHFMINPDTSIYTEYYDKAGYLVEVSGKPLVHKSAEMVGDSLALKWYFFSLKKEYKKIEVLCNNKTVQLKLLGDTLFSNVKKATYMVCSSHKEWDINGLLKVEYINECTGESYNFEDSIKIYYKPR
jgi:hypothetical protein